MAGERKPRALPTRGQPAGAALDSLNAELKARRDPSRAHRRRIESAIEEEAKKRRSQEAPVSSAYKSQG